MSSGAARGAGAELVRGRGQEESPSPSPPLLSKLSAGFRGLLDFTFTGLLFFMEPLMEDFAVPAVAVLGLEGLVLGSEEGVREEVKEVEEDGGSSRSLLAYAAEESRGGWMDGWKEGGKEG